MTPPTFLLRSRFGTIRTLRLDWSEFSLRSGWGTVEAFGRRVCGLATIGLLIVAINPVWLPSQTPMIYQMQTDLGQSLRRLDSLEVKLADVPGKLSDMSLKMAVMDQRISQQNDSIARLNELALWIGKGVGGLILAGIAWAIRMMFFDFGGKERRGRA